MVTDRQLALFTSLQIKECGGLQEASDACRQLARPYSVQQLSRCQTAGSGCYLPLDIVAALESYSGKPIISKALADSRPSSGAGDLLADVAEESEDALALQGLVRRLASKTGFNRADCDQARRMLAKLLDDAARVAEDLERAGCPR